MVEIHKISAAVKWVQPDRVSTNYGVLGYVAKISSPLARLHDELVVNVLPCPFNFTVLPHINPSRQSMPTLYAKKMLLKLVHYCTLLSMVCHFDASIITQLVTFHNKTG